MTDSLNRVTSLAGDDYGDLKVEFYDENGTPDFVEDVTELHGSLNCHSYRRFW